MNRLFFNPAGECIMRSDRDRLISAKVRQLQKRIPQVTFLGQKKGNNLISERQVYQQRSTPHAFSLVLTSTFS